MVDFFNKADFESQGEGTFGTADFNQITEGVPTDEELFPEDGDLFAVTPPDDFLARNTDSEGNVDEGAAEAEFVAHIRKTYQMDTSSDYYNREAAQEDLRFAAGEQWPDHIKAKREAAGKPVMTINRIPAFVSVIVGNRRMNEAAVKILPADGGTKEGARIRQGLIRAIEQTSKATDVYNTAHTNQVICGDGAWQIVLDYADNDVFVQEPKIEAIPDALAVVWDHQSIECTGRDARHVFVEETLTKDEFQQAYPDAKLSSFDMVGSWPTDVRRMGWYKDESYRVVSYWRMRSTLRTLALMQGNKVVDVTEVPQSEWMPFAIRHPQTGRPYVRRAPRVYAEQYITNGVELLEGPYHLPIDRVPVFRALGWDIFAAGQRQRWGLVRFLKDPLRMHNFWRSVIVEKIMLAPKNVWLAGASAVEGRESSFRSSVYSDDPLLVYNDEAGTAPTRIDPANIESAMLNEANITIQDVKDVSNLHEASLGMPSNEVSNVAIQSRQRIGETGTVLYQDNLNSAIEETGRVLNAIIPYVYDTVRTVRIVGDEDMPSIVDINGDNGVDVTAGKYFVTVTTGPSFATKRVEAQDSMLNMINAMPQTMTIAADKIIEAQDWPGADEIARRIRTQLPPGVVSDEDMPPALQQARQQANQLQQQMQELEMRTKMAELAMKESQAEDYRARAQQALANAAKAMASIDLDTLEIMTEAESTKLRDFLEQVRVAHEIDSPVTPEGDNDVR